MPSVFPAHIHPTDKRIVQDCNVHSRNTAQYAANALKSMNLFSSAYLAGLVHDLGKYKLEFKAYLEAVANNESPRKGSVVHTFAGTKHLLKYHTQDSELTFSNMTSEILAYAVGAHHGLFDCVNEHHESGFLHRLETEPSGDGNALDNFLKDCADTTELNELFQKATLELEPLISSCYYDMANDYEEAYFFWGLIVRLLTSAVMEGDRRDTAEFMHSTKFPVEANSKLWQALLLNTEIRLKELSLDGPINTARRMISDRCRTAADKPTGIYRLNIPTGSGKTLSSLRYALAHAEKFEKKRIIFTSPLLSVLDQNSRVIRDFVGDQHVLEHHSNVLQEQKLPQENTGYELLTESWASPIIITTLVQLLNTMFDGKTSSVRRFHTLTNAVIVIDEVQTVPCNMLSLFNLTISFLAKFCNTTILLCSATQPCLEAVEHPICCDIGDIIPYDPELWSVFKRTEIRFAGGLQILDIPIFAQEILANVESLLIVCNKKSESEMLYRAFDTNSYNIFHLSAAMCMEHRRQTLHELQKSLEQAERKTICVATQVIEAGIDISFQAVIRLTAGLDSIIQAAGRCNRNGESAEPGQVFVIRALDENMTHLHDIKLAQQATDVLLDTYEHAPTTFNTDLSSDTSVQYYYHQLFRMQSQDNRFYHNYPVDGGTTLFELLSQNSDWWRPQSDEPYTFLLHQAFASAGKLFEVFDSDTTDVIVPWGNGEVIIAELLSERAKHDFNYVKDLFEQARTHTVSLSAWQKKKLEDSGALVPLLGGIMLGLAPEFYHDRTGVQLNTTKEVYGECNTLIW